MEMHEISGAGEWIGAVVLSIVIWAAIIAGLSVL